MAAGSDAYVAKPFSPRQLLATIREFLGTAVGRRPCASRRASWSSTTTPANLEILRTRLAAQGYEVVDGHDGEEACRRARADARPDPARRDDAGKDGIEVCRELKADPSLPFMPIILVTAKADPEDIVAGLDAGGDEYLTKPVDHAALVARVRSILRIKALHDTVQEQAAPSSRSGTARSSSASPRRWPRSSGSGRSSASSRRRWPSSSSRRRRAPAREPPPRDHRGVLRPARLHRLRRAAEPEEVMGVLREYHAALGELIFRHEGTLERFVGDGLVVLFNDPLPCPDPVGARRAHGGRDARRASPSSPKAGAGKATSSASASASPRATPRSAGSASRAASTTPRSARWRTSPRACATRPPTARS